MKYQIPLLVITIIGIGVYLGFQIAQIEPQKSAEPHDHHEDHHEKDKHDHEEEAKSKINLTKRDPQAGWEYSPIEARAEIFPEMIKNLDITTSKAGPAKIKIIQQLTGEVSLNEEKVVHIVPRLDGVVRKVLKDLGDRVENGELLARSGKPGTC